MKTPFLRTALAASAAVGLTMGLAACSDDSATADGNGGLSVNGSQGNPQVLLPASALNKSGSLCPNLATGAQKSSASSVLLPVGTALGVAVVIAQFFL